MYFLKVYEMNQFFAHFFQSFQKELGAHQKTVDSANTCGRHLETKILDDPTVTQQDMRVCKTRLQYRK